MEKFLIVFRGATVGESEGPRHNPLQWDAWFDGLGAALVDRGALSHGSVEVPTRLIGPKLSSSALSGYCLVTAADFNEAVRLAESSPIFDEQGSVEIAHLMA
ncbi:hypothetical protein [Massilia sp. Leaf139]|uniref:hypothetical protein n=1 Tax=Massilia sp. Leaf139 TaxID=1736272 RepID=UPI0012E79ED6|nr:hypothetical protein [Massilia sp. Leaf139]